MTQIREITFSDWCPVLSAAEQHTLAKQLEAGNVLYFPSLPFHLLETERYFVKQDIVGMRAKNVSVNPVTLRFKGVDCSVSQSAALMQMCSRYHVQSQQLLQALFPFYTKSLVAGMTSFRPIEIEGRVSDSYKKDDTRLHIDAFPSRPNQGRRILRVFTNVNPENKPRVWRMGEPFDVVARRFAARLKKPWRGSAWLRRVCHITKGYRTLYDSYMLQLHDCMKADLNYQRSIQYEEMAFPPGATWIVFSDAVSHAVMSGQHLMEQTMYLPVSGMVSPACSPLRILEKMLGKKLTMNH